jgi:hypothetical protein
MALGTWASALAGEQNVTSEYEKIVQQQFVRRLQRKIATDRNELYHGKGN